MMDVDNRGVTGLDLVDAGDDLHVRAREVGPLQLLPEGRVLRVRRADQDTRKQDAETPLHRNLPFPNSCSRTRVAAGVAVRQGPAAIAEQPSSGGARNG